MLTMFQEFFEGFHGPDGRGRRRFMNHYGVFVSSTLIDLNLVICGNKTTTQTASEEVEGVRAHVNVVTARLLLIGVSKNAAAPSVSGAV